MFEFEDNTNFLTKEKEKKPNLYTAKALQVAIVFILFSLLLNEADIFHINLKLMRGYCAVSLLFALLPQFLIRSRRITGNFWCKYVFLFCTFAVTFIMDTSLFIFVTPVCVLPMLLGGMYNSKRFALLSIISSCIVAAVAPPLGCALGLWEPRFIKYLLSGAIGANLSIELLDPINKAELFRNIFVFISLPWLMCSILFGRIILSMALKGVENIENQIKLRELTKLDALTGLYSQNTYMNFLNADHGKGSVGILFFDVNGLKETNDRFGHECGNILLNRCAKSLDVIIDEKSRGFRIGGDEYLVLVDTDDPSELDRRLDRWKAEIQTLNQEERSDPCPIPCLMSVGTAFGDVRDLESLISEADTRMYENKKEYYREKETL